MKTVQELSNEVQECHQSDFETILSQMNHDTALASLEDLRRSAWEKYDKIENKKPMPKEGDDQRSADMLYARGIAFGTAIQIIKSSNGKTKN